MENEQMQPVEEQVAEVAPAEAVVETAPVAEVVAPKKGKVGAIVFAAIMWLGMVLFCGIADGWYLPIKELIKYNFTVVFNHIAFAFVALCGIACWAVGLFLKKEKVAKLLRVIGLSVVTAVVFLQMISWASYMFMLFGDLDPEEIFAVLFYPHIYFALALLVLGLACLFATLKTAKGAKPGFNKGAKLCMVFGIILGATAAVIHMTWGFAAFEMFHLSFVYVVMQNVFGVIAMRKIGNLND